MTTARFDPARPDSWPATLTVDAVAQVLCVSRRTVHRHKHRPGFPRPHRLSRKLVRWPREQFLAWMRATQPELLSEGGAS
jgi:predicted DNA-binding transcriptional regulator AlpA